MIVRHHLPHDADCCCTLAEWRSASAASNMHFRSERRLPDSRRRPGGGVEKWETETAAGLRGGDGGGAKWKEWTERADNKRENPSGCRDKRESHEPPGFTDLSALPTEAAVCSAWGRGEGFCLWENENKCAPAGVFHKGGLTELKNLKVRGSGFSFYFLSKLGLLSTR